MTSKAEFTHDGLESQIDRWRGYVQGHQAISPGDVDELEAHLRAQVADLQDDGLSDDEAFLVAVKRMGNLDEVSREFSQEHSDRLWKQLVLMRPAEPDRSAAHRELFIVLVLAVAAAVAVKVPTLWSQDIDDPSYYYARNLSLFTLPFLAGYFAWKRKMGLRAALRWLVPPFAVAVVVADGYPFVENGASEILVAIHLPIALWSVVGLAYVGGQWRSHARRMDFVRFTGEFVVYYTLLAVGGGVLMGLTAAAFQAVGTDPTTILTDWVLPCGVVGAVIVGAWLVEAKQNVIENIAPVLTKVFTPLSAVMLAAFLIALLAANSLVFGNRELLILADLILVLVLGLVLYTISARDPYAAPVLFDMLQFVLVLTVLAIDLLMLAAMVGRTAQFGVSPNKVAALGLNLVLLVNLAGTAWLLLNVLWRGGRFSVLERWQTSYLPVFAVWATTVAVVIPPAFGWE